MSDEMGMASLEVVGVEGGRSRARLWLFSPRTTSIVGWSGLSDQTRTPNLARPEGRRALLWHMGRLSLPPLLPTLAALLHSLSIPSKPITVSAISPRLMHAVLEAVLRQDLPVPPLPPHTSSEHTERRRHEVETVKLIVGILTVKLELDFGELVPARVVDRADDEIAVLVRGLILLALQEGWDGQTRWDRHSNDGPSAQTARPSARTDVRVKRADKPKRKTVVFSAFESPLPSVLPLPLTPSASPGGPDGHAHVSPSPPGSTLPVVLPLNVDKTRPPGRVSPPGRTLAEDPLPVANDLVTRFTAPEEWNRRRLIEKDALELAISSLDQAG